MLRAVLAALIVVCFSLTHAVGQATPSTYDALIEEAQAAMMADPAQALAKAQAAEAQAETNNRTEGHAHSVAAALWLQGEALTRLGRATDASPVVDRAISLLGASPPPTQLYADLLVARGRIAKDRGDYALALDSMGRAYDIYLEIDALRNQSIVLQTIGSIYSAGGRYEQAIQHFSDAAERYEDPILELAASNNMANAYREMGRYDEAMIAFQAALQIAEAMDSQVLQARILNNLGALHAANAAYDEADEVIDRAFALFEGREAGEWSRFLYGVRAQTALGRGELETARDDIQRTFEGVPLEASTQPFTDFHETAVEIYTGLGQFERALEHAQAFKRLEDAARDIAASANTALLAAQFEFTEQELQINQLRTTGLEQDLALATARSRTRLIGAGAALALIFGALLFSLYLYRASKERQAILANALYTDAMTGLPSRSALERALAKAEARDREVALLVVSINRRDALNGALGFGAFADLCVQLAERLKTDAATEKLGLIANGDLGVILDYAPQDSLLDEDYLEQVAMRLHRLVQEPFKIDDIDIDLTVTVGGMPYEGDDCIKQAMIAVEQARETHVGFARFDAKTFGDPSENLALMSRMAVAISEGHMDLHYQPKLNLRTGQFDGAEALARWHDPKTGNISPGQFVPLAEETGHIWSLTEWALKRIARDQLALSRAGHDVALSINISGALLTDPDFAALAARIAAQAPGQLIFEITETAIVYDMKRAAHTLDQWVRAGVKLSIDDYGVGQSSLAYLKDLQAHELKLDRFFLQDFNDSHRDRLLVRSSVEMAHTLGMQCTVEGVEDADMLPALQGLGADWAQGFGLARPMPVMDLVGLFQHQAEGDAPLSLYRP